MLGRAGQGVGPRAVGRSEHGDERGALRRRRGRRLRGLADDGEDRALDRRASRRRRRPSDAAASAARPRSSRRPRRASASTSVRPRRICERITPELPRAPMSEPWLMALQAAARSAPAPSSSVDDRLEGEGHVRAGVAVGHRVDVEPVDAGSWWARERVAVARRRRRAGRRRRGARGAWRPMVASRLTPTRGASAPGAATMAVRTAAARQAAGTVLPPQLPASEVPPVMAAVCEVCGKHPSFGMKRQPLPPSHEASVEPEHPARPRRRRRHAPSGSTSAPRASRPARSRSRPLGDRRADVQAWSGRRRAATSTVDPTPS